MFTSVCNMTAVLFDMDGVLIDSNAVIERAWHEAAQISGKRLTEDNIVKHIHGQPGPHTIQALFSDLPLANQQRIQAHIIHVENTADYDPIPGVAELILSLHSAGICVGIVTSGWREKSIVYWQCLRFSTAFQRSLNAMTYHAANLSPIPTFSQHSVWALPPVKPWYSRIQEAV